MGTPSPANVKKDFGLKQGRLTLPPSTEYSSPGANYIAAASNTLPLATSTPHQREMLHYKITWTDKVRNVFRLRKKKKGGFSTDPDVVHHPQPFSRATGAMVHSMPKIFDPSTASVENLAQHSSSEDDIPQSLLEDTLPGKAAAGDHGDKHKQREKVKKKDITRKGQQKQASVDDEDGLKNIDSSVTDHNESSVVGQHSSGITQSPSDLSKSSAREHSSQQSSSDTSSSEDEGTASGYRNISPVTSSEWQEQIISQHKKRKKSIRSMDYESRHTVNVERPLSAGNSTENLNQDDDFGRRKLTHNISDSVIIDNEYKRSKKRKPERVKGPHKSRENLGRPTILDVDMKNQQQPSIDGEEAVDFNTVPLISRLSTKAAHDKRGVAKNIKRRKATTKRSLFLHTDEELKYNTSIVDPSANAQSAKSSELQKAEQMVEFLRQPPQQSSSASIATKAVEQKRNSTEKNPVDFTEHSPELKRTDSKRKFGMSLLINKQILDSPLKTPVMPSPSPKPHRIEPNIFEQVKLKPINNSPIKTEKSDTTTTNTVTKDKSSVPAVREKPRRAVAPTQDKAQDLASPVKEHRTNMPKLTPVHLDTATKMDTREAAISLPLKETRLPSITEHKRTKNRRAKTVAQPVKAIGYMKDAPSKPAWIELAQQKTRRVGEALSSTDKLPQLSPSPAKQKSDGDKVFFNENSSPEEMGTETSKESGLPVEGYVRRRLRTFSQDQTPKA